MIGHTLTWAEQVGVRVLRRRPRGGSTAVSGRAWTLRVRSNIYGKRFTGRQGDPAEVAVGISRSVGTSQGCDRDAGLQLSRINVRAISHRDCHCRSQTAPRHLMARRPRSGTEMFHAPAPQNPEAEKVSRQIDEELRVRLICAAFDLPRGLTPSHRKRQTS